MRVCGTEEQNRSGPVEVAYRLDAGSWLQIFVGLILPVLCLILAALICGCEGGIALDAPRPDQLPVRGGTLRFLHGQVGVLDPLHCADLSEAAVISQIFEGLVDLDRNVGIRPCLAESWVISRDGILHTFLLRRGVLFHDGTPLTAEVVVQSLHRALQHASEGASRLMSIEGAQEFTQGAADHVSGLEALGPDTVRMRLAEPDPGFLPALAMVGLWIAAPPEYGGYSGNPSGTGPFILVHRAPDGSIHLARNDDYWGGKAHLDSLVFIDSSHISCEEKIARMLRRAAHVMEGGCREQEILIDMAGYQLLRDPAPGEAPQGAPLQPG